MCAGLRVVHITLNLNLSALGGVGVKLASSLDPFSLFCVIRLINDWFDVFVPITICDLFHGRFHDGCHL